ncbi:MAG: diguanylate cyclase domain-containing protein, partial [Prochlorothrix sp.]
METPVMEVEFGGRITYLNPAALKQFPDLRDQQHEHPLLHTQVPLAADQSLPKIWHRTIEVAGRYFEQAIHLLPESELLRILMTDVTARHQAEREVARRDRLLQAMAKATQCLLTDMDHTAAMAKAIAILGEATEVDRVCLYENHPDPQEGHLAMSLRLEWVRSGISSLLQADHSQNRNYTHLGLQDWYQRLLEGEMIQGSRADFPTPVQAMLRQDGVQSLLIQGLQRGPEFWGHISFQTCETRRHWTPQECDLLITLASSLSATLERQHAEADIRYQATHDALTGLANRSLFQERLNEALQQVRHSQQHLAVLFLDLDRFKEVNDRLGHALGDQLLQAVTQRLQSILEPSHLLARWGGTSLRLFFGRSPTSMKPSGASHFRENSQIARRPLR